jgi:hypothetical protein
MKIVRTGIRCQSDKHNKNDNYISLKQACELLFLTESSVRYYILKKRFRAFKSGGRWYLLKTDIETFKQWYKIDKPKPT